MNTLRLRLTVKVCLMSLCLGISSSAGAFGDLTVSQQPGRITAMNAFTADPGEGALSLSDDIFARQQGSKIPFAGIGAANYPTHYLLVMVEVTGSYGHRVELTATEGRKVVWRKTSSTNVPTGASYMEPVKSYAIFFIEGDRCEIIKLRARLVAPGKPSVMTKAIEFACGE